MKNKRFPLIRQLVTSQPISTQAELVAALSERGVAATQATVSRDIKMLGLVKRVDENGVQRYFLAEEQGQQADAQRKLIVLLRDAMVSMETAANLLVVRTMPGHAHAVASQLDSIGWSNLVSTLAGDDTVLLIAKTGAQAQELERQIYNLLE